MSIAADFPTSPSVILLDDIDWETYETLRAVDANRNIRMTYDRGALFLMSPSKLHAHDADRDPPPDLSIEVDVTSISTARMPIYAAFGIPEVWRWYDERIIVYRLVDGEYHEVEDSVCLPGFPFAEAARTLTNRLNYDETTLIRGFREFVERLKSG